ncbi:ribonuclease H-like domain-containing protein [Suillus paluster]|uniref:ribonuclease H-like domain-containing protein n=1 Tax=Suillus paluster TaxID=48578 RepID=UPI001B8813B9|nr:ribonuclease H-like domain-containing protein [Suillus paluster]KAG1748346.1 ribonuclease H-like domain-containing protein [Suillus paluster]
MAREWRKEASDYMASKAVQGKGKGVVLEAGSKSDSDSNDVMEVEDRPMKKPRMELQVASFNKKYVTEGHKALKVKGDHALMLFLTCTGIPPHVIDSDEFKAFCSILNANYKPASATTLADTLISNESARITKTMFDYLKTQRDLTITFDGGKIRKPKLFYTVHVTTADRQTLLLELDDASMLSHTAQYIGELLEGVIAEIRPYNFSGSSSDDTGNTKNSRRDLSAKQPYILNLQDACHLLSLCSKQICQLPEFKEVSDHLRKILAFMDKSGYAMEHFNYQRGVLKIGQGLEKISKTRFANIHWSAASLQCCLPAMQAIVSNLSLGINVKGRNHLFEVNTTDSLMFQVALAKLIAITGPYAKAIQCLESAHTTCADVYLYWLAIVAQMEQLLRGNTIRLLEETKLAICAITNARCGYNKCSGEKSIYYTVGSLLPTASLESKHMINDAPNDPYITAFFLHPEYQTAQIYKNINPLDLPPIHLMKSNGTYSVVSPEDSIIKRVGTSLQLMLKHEYGDVYNGVRSDQAAAKLMKERNPRLAGLTPQEALQALKVELKEYRKGADPFNCKIRKHENVRDWWLAVQKDENARVLGALAIKLYSVVPVSMADERTVSTIMWLNSPTRSRQDISTLKEHIQIRQWHCWQADPVAPTVTPSVKWRDMYATIHGKPETPPVVPPPARLPTMKTDIILSLTNEHQGRCSDLDAEAGDWLDNGDIADHVGLAGVKSTEFDVGKDIDLSSTYLLDILSDHAVQPTVAWGGLSTPKVMADQATTSSLTPMDDEWEKW